MKAVNKILSREIRANSFNLAGIVLLMLAAVGLDVLIPWPFKLLIDNVLSANPIELSRQIPVISQILQSRYLLGFSAILIYFLSTFLLSIVEYAKSSGTKKVIKNMTANFSKQAFANLEKLEIGFYKKQQIGDFIYRLSYDVSALGEFLEDGVLPFATSVLYLIVTLGIMFIINYKLTLLSFIALPFLAVGLYSFNLHTVRATKKSEFLNSVTFSFIEEALMHLKVIQAFTQEPAKARAFDRRAEASLKSDVTMYKLDFMLSLLVGIIIAVSYSLIILYGIYSVFSGALTTGLLIVFILYLDNLTIPLQNMIYAATIMKQSYVKTLRMNDFFTSRTHLKNTGVITNLTDTTIKFDHVSLKAEKNQSILRDISFTIPARKSTVIFGPNGSGKTSVVNLLLRFVERPSEGRIFIGGIPIEKYNIQALREEIAYVPQEITLFDDTIHRNIAFGNSRATDKMIHEAARMADADSFITKLPGKYSFKAGEGGTLLSGGQKQKIMLARALIKKDVKILLLDETFSALDVKSRKKVMDNIYKFSAGKTMIAISHIFDIVSAADHAIVLDEGRVIYEGPTRNLHKELELYKMIIRSEE